MLLRPFKILGESLVNMWRNKTITIFSIISVTASLIILGILFSIILNINSIALSAGNQFDTITVYLEDELSTEGIEDLISGIEYLNEVESVLYISKEDALQRLKERWGENGYLLEDLESNPLPRSLVITLKDIVYSDLIKSGLENRDGIEEIKSYQNIVNTMMTATNWLRKSGTILIFILIGVSTILIHNAIRLAVESREREIMIMKYIGATNWHIRWPFVVEGMIIGLIGAGLAFTAIWFGYNYVYTIIQKSFFEIISAYIVLPEYIISDLIFLFIVIGVCIGALGSIISTRRSLNV